MSQNNRKIIEVLLPQKISGRYSKGKDYDVYKNPPSIKNMSSSVRGVTTPDGDLYVVDSYGLRDGKPLDVIHGDIFDYLKINLGILSQHVGDFGKYDLFDGFLGWQRYEKTNKMYLSEGTDEEFIMKYDKNIEKQIDILNKKHQSITFVPTNINDAGYEEIGKKYYSNYINERIKRIINEEVLSSLDIVEVDNNQYSNIKKKDRIVMTDSDEIRVPFRIRQESGKKPDGLWYGLGTGWIDWVRYEMPQWEKPNAFKLKLNESKIIKINSDNVDDFEKKYIINTIKYLPMIDWKKISEEYSGVEVYFSVMRKNWLWGWDVESGCVWNSDAIIDIEKI